MLHVTEYFAKSLSHSWLLEMAPFDRLHTSSYWLSIVTVALSCVISEIKRNIGRKLRFFHAPPVLNAPVMGVRRNIAISFGVEKLECCAYPTVRKV